MNWTVLALIGIAVLALIIFLVMRNQKDKKELENQIKNDYRKPRDEEGDTAIEDNFK